MIWFILGDARHYEKGNFKLEWQERKEKMAWIVALLSLMWVVWREINRRAFEGLLKNFIKLRSSFLSFFCMHPRNSCMYRRLGVVRRKSFCIVGLFECTFP